MSPNDTDAPQRKSQVLHNPSLRRVEIACLRHIHTPQANPTNPIAGMPQIFGERSERMRLVEEIKTAAVCTSEEASKKRELSLERETFDPMLAGKSSALAIPSKCRNGKGWFSASSTAIFYQISMI